MPLHKDKDNFDNLLVINEKINEIKKKIQLSEGQRKAHFEECDAEKKRNLERIHVLKKEVKEIYKKLAEPSFCKESILKVSSCYPKGVSALRNKKLEEAIEFMDLKCIDLNKQLDVFKFRNRLVRKMRLDYDKGVFWLRQAIVICWYKRKMKLKKIAEEYRNQVRKLSNTKARKVETVSNKPICVLENQIHRVEMNMMEAEHVNKKYKTIRLQLLSDSVEFESSLKKVEEEIRRQNIEIKHLDVVNKEAFDLRDVTKGTLLRHEILALSAGKVRDNQLLDFRHRVEERKLELERLERRIFPAGKVIFDESGDVGPAVQASEATNKLICQLEAYFTKLKLATGETETEEVLTRFLFQKETKRRLDFLKKITEEEKKQLELRKEMSLTELEAFKFSEVKDREENQEELEETRSSIEVQKALEVKYTKEAERIVDQLSGITKCLTSLVDDLREMNEETQPDYSKDPNSYISCLEYLIRKIKSGFSKMGLGENLEEILKTLERSQYHHLITEISFQIPGEETLLFPGLIQQDEGKQAKAQQSSLLVPETDDEEDVLSRSHVKRQAQLIVDAKSRKKFSRVINIPRTKK